MILYHMDRALSIDPSTNIDFVVPESNISDSKFLEIFDRKISKHGERYLSLVCTTAPLCPSRDFRAAITIDNLNSLLFDTDHKILEYTLELVRRAYFPHFPSRMQCLFAVSDIDQFAHWPGFDVVKYPVYRIEVSGETPKFDSAWLRGGLSRGRTDTGYFVSYAPTLCFEIAYNYWSQESTDSPIWEYLIQLPVDRNNLSPVCNAL